MKAAFKVVGETKIVATEMSRLQSEKMFQSTFWWVEEESLQTYGKLTAPTSALISCKKRNAFTFITTLADVEGASSVTRLTATAKKS